MADDRLRARVEEIRRWEDRMLLKWGWYAHLVPVIDGTINYHTHGLERGYGHPDFQITLPIEPRIANGIAGALVDLVKEGVRFEAGARCPGIIADGYDVTFAEAVESDRRVLRVILPDTSGELERGRIAPPFDRQYR